MAGADMSRAVKGTPHREMNEVPFSCRDQKNVIRTSGGCGCTCDSGRKTFRSMREPAAHTYDDQTIPNPSEYHGEKDGGGVHLTEPATDSKRRPFDRFLPNTPCHAVQTKPSVQFLD